MFIKYFPDPKDNSFTITNDKGKQLIFTFNNLAPSNV